jgi:hypothetical protein
MNLDIRFPIGLMFTIIGAMIAGYGLVTAGSELYQRSLGMNINLVWGAVLLAFGLIMLVFGWRGQAKARDSQPPRK